MLRWAQEAEIAQSGAAEQSVQLHLHHLSALKITGAIISIPALQLLGRAERFRQHDHATTRADAMKDYQKTFSENVNAVGLTAYPGALIINKRFANIPAGVPIFMYNWAEDNIIRAGVFAPADKQIGAELHPGELAGKLGESAMKAE